MASELVPDLLNGLVAAGTLALAAATYGSVRVARQGAVDTASHRVLVTTLWVDNDVHAESSTASSTPAIKPGTAWDLAQYRSTRIALRASGHLRNEGTATARLRFSHDSHVKLISVSRQASLSTGSVVPVPVTEHDGWYLLAPATEADFVLIWWRTLADWTETWQLGTERRAEVTPPTATTVQLTIRGAVARGAVDECEIQFGAYVVVPHPNQSSWVIADNGPQAVPPVGAPHRPVAEIGLIKRSYPRKG